MLFDIPADVRKIVWRHARYLSAKDAVEDHLRVRTSPMRQYCSLRLTLPVRRASEKSICWSKWDTFTGIDYMLSVYVKDQFLTGVCVDEECTGRYWRRREGSSRWHLVGPDF